MAARSLCRRATLHLANRSRLADTHRAYFRGQRDAGPHCRIKGGLQWGRFPGPVARLRSRRCCRRCQLSRTRSRMSLGDRKSTRLNSSHSQISYAVFCLKKKKKQKYRTYIKKKKQKEKTT